MSKPSSFDNNKKIAQKIIIFLKKEFGKRKKKKVILGLSGGLDSTATALLCKKAGLDLYGILLPYRKKGLEDSRKIAQILKLSKNRIISTDIGPAVDAQVKELQKIMKIDRLDRGNIMARQRMIIQYALARKVGGLVIGTEDLSEYYLGYFTLHGDQACDITAISGLFKTEVRRLAEYLGAPEWAWSKKPSPDLWKGQTAENELGFSYEEADPILRLYCLEGYSKDKIIKKGYTLKLINKVLERVKATEYKRQHPPKL